jgi:purine-binding chemotaxis protein CheW
MASQAADSSVLLVAFLIDGNRYALRLAQVERVLPLVAVSPLPKAPDIALGVINLGGEVVPVLDLRRRLGFPARGYGVRAHLIAARTARRRVALPVDEALGVMEVAAGAVTPPDAVLPGTAHVAGIAALPDGLLLIHDLDAFLSLEEEAQLGAVLEEGRA